MSSCHERDANYREERNQTIRPEHCRELAKLASGTTSSIIDTPHDLIYSLNILFSQFPNTRLFCPLLVRKLFISPCNCATKFDNEERENRPSARNKLQIAVIAGMRGSQLYIEAARLPRASVERLERILIGFPSNLIDTPHPERESSSVELEHVSLATRLDPPTSLDWRTLMGHGRARKYFRRSWTERTNRSAGSVRYR